MKDFEKLMPKEAEYEAGVKLPQVSMADPEDMRTVALLKNQQRKLTYMLCLDIVLFGICVITAALGFKNAVAKDPCFVWFTIAEITAVPGFILVWKICKLYEKNEEDFYKASDFVKASKYKAEMDLYHNLKVISIIVGVISFSGIFLLLDMRQEDLSCACGVLFVICLFAAPLLYGLEDNYRYHFELRAQDDKCAHCAYDPDVLKCRYHKENCRVPDADDTKKKKR